MCGPGLVGLMGRQGCCGVLETSPAAVLLEQGLVDPGADIRSWAVGRAGGFPGDWAGTARSGGTLSA